MKSLRLKVRVQAPSCQKRLSGWRGRNGAHQGQTLARSALLVLKVHWYLIINRVSLNIVSQGRSSAGW
jgi:hypothetical protein